MFAGLATADDGGKVPAHVRTEAQREAWRIGWPCWRGPYGCGAGIDCGYELVRKSSDARLVWKSEDMIPAPYGQGGVSFFSSPIVADGRVFIYYNLGNNRVIDEEFKERIGGQLHKHKDHRFFLRQASVTGDDIVHCFDALTGKTLWKVVVGEGVTQPSERGATKAGGHYTMCVKGDRAIVLDNMSRVHCLKVNDGSILWRAHLGSHQYLADLLAEGIKDKKIARAPGLNAAPQVARNTVVCRDSCPVKGQGADELCGFDLETGKLKWTRGPVRGGSRNSASHIVWRAEDGKDYILHEHPLMCIDPDTGKVLWKVDLPGMGGTIGAFGDSMVFTSYAAPNGKEDAGSQYGYALGYRISLKGCEHLWTLPGSKESYGIKQFRSWSLYKGRAYINGGDRLVKGDNGVDGWGQFIIDAKTGKILTTFAGSAGQDAFGYGMIAAEGRYIGPSGDIMGTDPESAWFADSRNDGPWDTDPCIAGAYACGWHYVRGSQYMYCYDIRAKAKAGHPPAPPKRSQAVGEEAGPGGSE